MDGNCFVNVESIHTELQNLTQSNGRRLRDAISRINELATGKSGTPTLVVREVTQLTRLRETTKCNIYICFLTAPLRLHESLTLLQQEARNEFALQFARRH